MSCSVTDNTLYRGRFAPSPTGPLHFGSLVAALGSYLDARHHHGEWRLRIEDIDPPREVSGSAQRIISDLAWLGIRPDQAVLFQSNRVPAYQVALDRLLAAGHAYPCACTRKDLPVSGLYPGTCRKGIPEGREPRAIRFRRDGKDSTFNDRIQGLISEPAKNLDDFVIRRADGLIAYQLAVVVDDAFQQVTEVVRGADLLASSHRQICLQKALGFAQPVYAHLPVAVNADGSKLAKRLQTDPFRYGNPVRVLHSALEFLGQQPPAGLDLDSLWCWATTHWNWKQIPRCQTRVAAKS